MAEEVKDEPVAEPTPSPLPNVDVVRKISLGPPVVPARPAHNGPYVVKFSEARTPGRLQPLTQLEQDIPWKFVFVLYALFAVGALILFGLFLMIMIRMYRQQVFQ